MESPPRNKEMDPEAIREMVKSRYGSIAKEKSSSCCATQTPEMLARAAGYNDEELNQVPEDLWAASFYREIVSLCAAKGCLIVAEGVETQLQSDFVRWAGVDLIQGFLYSFPELLTA